MPAMTYEVTRTFLATAPNIIDPKEKMYYAGSNPSLDSANPAVVAALAAGVLIDPASAEYDESAYVASLVQATKLYTWDLTGAAYGATKGTAYYGDGGTEAVSGPPFHGTHTYTKAGTYDVVIQLNNGMRIERKNTIYP